jgi:hypothetical protein
MKEQIKLNDPEIKKLYESFNAELKEKILDGFDEKISDYNRFVTSFKTRFKKVFPEEGQETEKEFSEYVLLHSKRKKELLGMIKKHSDILDYNTLNLFFDKYSKAYIDFSLKLQNRFTRREKEEKYDLKFQGNPLLFFRKFISNMKLWAIYKASAFVNFLRKLFKKPPIDYTKYRKRRIPFRQMTNFYLVAQLSASVSSLIPKLMEERNTVLLKLWEADKQLEVWFHNKLSQTPEKEEEETVNPDNNLYNELKKSGQSLQNEIHDVIDESIDQVFLDFDHSIQKVDTLDLATTGFNPREVNRKTAIVEIKFTDIMVPWNNSTKTLYDDWSMDIEISLLYYSVFKEYYKLKNKLTNFITKNLAVNFKKLEDFINESNTRLATASGSVKLAREMLNKEREVLNKELIDKLLTRTIEKLTGNFVEDFDSLQSRTLNLVEDVSDKRGFSKNKNYLHGIKGSEISTISPRELLNFEALPHFEKKLEQIKVFVNSHLEKARVNLLSLGTVSDFNLESAALLLDQKKNAAKKAIQIAAEGYERALNHLEDSIKLIDEIKHEPLENLKEAINEFNVDIQKLKNTDNIHELNLKIARIKTIERSKKARQDTINAVSTFIPKSWHFIKTTYEKSHDYIARLRSRMGISTEKTEISFELSEFISETQAYLKKLPFVYQRLYQLQPTDEDRFFANRKDELDILTQAFEDWQKNRFVSVAILGEKGSGITSFINKFIRGTETETTIIRETLNKKINTREQYLAFFGELLGVEQFISNDDIIQHLNESEEYKIIIIENMHHLFLKLVGGFECLKLFFDLMANTTRKVLWICAYTRHSWDYLDLALQISDYYTREIELTKLSDKTIEEIIFRRNQLSGYKIIFKPPADHHENKIYNKLNEEEKQEYLRKEFFTNLNKSCNGNISLALLYWLRSTHEVTGESITITNLHEIDFSFVNAFSSEYLFTLHAIIIHDGLTLEDYSKIFNTTSHLARNILIPMLEKGLLIRPKEKYNINPILFRQVAQFLRSKNFIN